MLDDNGQEHTIEVAPNADADAQDAVAEGSVLVSVDGAYLPQVMQKEEVQKINDDATKRNSMGGYSPSKRKIAIYTYNKPLHLVEGFFFNEDEY